VSLVSPDVSHRSLVVGGVSAGHFLSHFYILVYPPLFPFFVDEFGLTNAELGLVMSVGTLGPLLLQILVGRVVDTVGGKWTLVVGLAVTAGGTALVATADSYLAVLAFAGVAGIGQAVFHPADYALLEAATTEDTRGRTFSIHTFGGYAGFAAAPLVVGLLAEQYGWQVALAGCGVVGLCYALALAVKLPALNRHSAETNDDDSSAASDGWRALLTPALLALFAFYFLTTVGIKGIQTFGPRFLSTWYDLSTTVSNLALTLFFAGTAAGILVGGRLADAYAESNVVVASLALVVAGVAVLSTGTLVGGVLVVGTLTLVGLAVGITLPSRDSLVSTVSAGNAGSSFGLVFTGLSLGGVVSPAVLGRLADATDLGTAFVAIAGCYVAAAAVVASLAWLHSDVRASPAASNED
jgi:MFS family permease